MSGLIKEIRQHQLYIHHRLGKEPNEIKMNYETLCVLQTTITYFQENIGYYHTIFGMKIFIDDRLKDNIFEITFSDINDIL